MTAEAIRRSGRLQDKQLSSQARQRASPRPQPAQELVMVKVFAVSSPVAL
jgi:hypothetical protein